MYTFGYSNRLGGPARALIAMAIGAVLVIYNGEALGLVVKIIAALLLASGVVSLAVALKKSKDGSSRLLLFNAVVDVVIAFLLFTFSVEVGNLIIYLIGFVLFGFGIFQLIALISANRVMKLGLWSFIMPTLVTLLGGFLLFNPFALNIMTIIAGTALLFYGIVELLSSWKMKKAIDEYEIRQAEEKPAMPENRVEVKDVEYEKVDEQ